MKTTLLFTTQPLVPAPPSFPLAGQTGAVIDFYGVVRGQEKGAALAGLAYEAYENMARRELDRLLQKLGALYPCQEVVFTHVIGLVPVGQPSVHVRVFAPHRAEAFALAQQLIDEMKQVVPIWKKAKML